MNIAEGIERLLLSCLVGTLFVALCPRRQVFRDLAVTWLILITAYYAGLRYSVLSAFEASSFTSWWQWSFAFFEGLALIYEIWSYFVIRRMTDHSAEADRCEAFLRQLPCDELPSVAIFFPAYNEPIGLVMASLRAALAIDYAGVLTICCLDDAGHPMKGKRRAEETRRLRRFCASNGILYFARPSGTRGKSGNLSHAYRRTKAEVIVVMDCDFKVFPGSFLWRLVGLLREHPEVGIVQCPQVFSNPDPFGTGLLAPTGIPDQQASFMFVVQPGRDYWGNAFCVGSGWAAYREDLDLIGGFAALETVGEDFEVTYRLLQKGKRTMFLNEVLAFGLAPEGLIEFWTQIRRWCRGSLQQLTLDVGPIRGKHKFVDRLFYLDPPLFWMTHFVSVQLLLAPILFLYFGVDALPDRDGAVLDVLAPRLVSRAILQYWLTQRIALPLIAALPKTLAAIPVCLTILNWTWGSANAYFRNTPKNNVREVSIVRWPMFSVFAGVTVLILLGIVLNEGAMLDTAANASALNYFWTAGSAIISFLAALVCIEVPSRKTKVIVGQTVKEGVPGTVLAGVLRRIVSLRM